MLIQLPIRVGRTQPLVQCVRQLSQASKPLQTCLYDFHVEHGGKMVAFAGYSMPVEYSSLGIIPSHLHTRKKSSIFDVSHMLQTHVYGKDRFEFMESLTVADVKGLKTNAGSLTVFTNEKGGISDDLIVTSAENHLYVVSNAGCRDKDMATMSNKAKEMLASGKDIGIEFIDNRGLVALQGPTMVDCLQPLVDIDLKQLTFMTSRVCTVAGIPNCRVTRCGYTGEDGVEISVAEENCRLLVEALLNSEGDAKLAGLGARDSLRLEAGLCLYGNDIDESTTPVEATLAWTIAKARRQAGGFPGDAIILGQLKNGATRKRVGFLSSGPPVRGHATILDQDGNKVGETTSGCPAPSLPKGNNISMGYVNKDVSKIGTKLNILVRNKPVPAVVSKMPFVPSNYYNGPPK